MTTSGLVMEGVVDLGIIGENVLEEVQLIRAAQGQPFAVKTLKQLDFGGCRLSLAVPDDVNYTGPESLADKRIATSYPGLLKRFFDEKGLGFKSVMLGGSVEVAPARVWPMPSAIWSPPARPWKPTA